MELLWPGFLFLLGIIPLLIAAYWFLLRRRRVAVRFSSLSLVRDLLPRQSALRRHLPFALFLLALACLVTALGRPVTVVAVPANRTTVLLAIDVSRSMCSTDIQPSRLEAAQTAAREFIRSQEANTRIGIVAFSGFAELIQLPTTDPELLQAAVDSLLTGRRTAIGGGIIKALEAIAEIDPSMAPLTYDAVIEPAPTPVPSGAYIPHIIVVLTDGVSNTGPEPLFAAQQAVDRGVRVYTIGFGTDNNTSFPNCMPHFEGYEPFDRGPQYGWGYGGGGFRRGIDEETLTQIADLTGGEYYSAESANELQNVFKSLPTHLITNHETLEVGALFALLGALFVTIGLILAMIWRPLP
jgi:Ca-activated chloride channel family protein